MAPHQAQTVALNEIPSQIPSGARVAVVLMTHNYEADLEILRYLKDHRVGYLGCLGPAARFERLQSDLLNLHGERIGEDLRSVARAPAGLFTHGQSPEEIALSITAQIQGELIEKPKDKTWTIVLAAGASSRFGGVKALAEFEGRTLLARALSTAREVSGENVLLVAGAHALEGAQHIARNPDWSRGMGNSIAFGVKSVLALDAKPGTILLLPVDQPFADARHLRALARTTLESGRCSLTSADELISPPAAVPRAHFERALSLDGERGLKSFLRPSDYICVENASAVKDFDRAEDLLSL